MRQKLIRSNTDVHDGNKSGDAQPLSQIIHNLLNQPDIVFENPLRNYEDKFSILNNKKYNIKDENILIYIVIKFFNEIQQLKKDSKVKVCNESVKNFKKYLNKSIKNFNASYCKDQNVIVLNDDKYLSELLHSALQYALKIEHSTIPPYLTALYSIKRGTNNEVVSTIRSVAVEEMLHMIMVCNVMNSMGYLPNILAKKLIPCYPYKFPFGEESPNKSFYVNIDNFSKTSIKTFIDIESPVNKMVKPIDTPKAFAASNISKDKFTQVSEDENVMNCYDKFITSLPFEKIGVFYEFITVLTFVRQWKSYNCSPTTDLTYEEFCTKGIFKNSNLNKQISSDQYYGSGGTLLQVENFHDFMQVIEEIMGQGEGSGGEMIAPNQHPDQDDLELAHYFRFMEVRHGKYYKGGKYPSVMPVETPPNGNELKVDWNAVYNIQTNLKIDKVSDEGIKQMLIDFNNNYRSLLDYINKAVSEVNKDQQNEFLQKSIMHMHQMHHQAEAIMKTPLDNDENAAPTWEISELLEEKLKEN